MSFAYPSVLALLVVPGAAPCVGLAARERAAGAAVRSRRPARGRGWAVGSGPGRVAAGPDPGRGHRAPGRTAAVERAAEQAGAYEYRILRRRLEQHDRRRWATARATTRSMKAIDELPRHPQGRCLRADVLRQQRAALGAADQRSLGDSLRAAVHEARERPALDGRHDDRQGPPGLQGDLDQPRGGRPHDHPGFRRRELRLERRQRRDDRPDAESGATSSSTRSTSPTGAPPPAIVNDHRADRRRGLPGGRPRCSHGGVPADRRDAQTKLEKTASELLDNFGPLCIAGLSLLGLSGCALFGLRYTPW